MRPNQQQYPQAPMGYYQQQPPMGYGVPPAQQQRFGMQPQQQQPYVMGQGTYAQQPGAQGFPHPQMQQQMFHQQQQPMGNIRAQQIQQLFQYFPGTVIMQNTQASQDLRVPLLLSQSQQPLFCKVMVPVQFPQMAPHVHVMHRVVHAKISQDDRFTYMDDKLINWKPHYNLLAIIRQMHQDFQLSPPVPQEILKKQMHQQSSQVSDVPSISENLQEEAAYQEQDPILAEDEPEEEAPFEMREEDERRELATKRIDEESASWIAKAKENISSSLASISLTELKRLADDDDYSDDTIMSSTIYLQMCKKKDGIEDETLKLATENIKLAQQLEEDQKNYAENVNPLFEEQRALACQSMEIIDAKQAGMSRENAIKVLKADANQKYKQSKNMASDFCKGGTQYSDFLAGFLASRTQYYQLQKYAEVVRHAPDSASA